MTGSDHARELDRMTDAYARRRPGDPGSKWAVLVRDERERVYRRILESIGPIESLRLVELGCGAGGEIRRLIGLGMDPRRIVGIELLPERVASARSSLPDEVRIEQGDATSTGLDDESFDVVFLSTVFTSILDDGVQLRFATEAWRVLRPGGVVLWYDFVVNNPRNPDVRGVPAERIRALFPEATSTFEPVTLLPPLGRAVARLGKMGTTMYRALSSIPMLRTHVVGALRKAAPERGADS